MRSFEQYILEARQNYIFGGTDDRNTDVDAKTFSELKPNDFVFAFGEDRNSNFGFNAWLVDCFYFSRKGGWKDLLKKHNAMDRTNYEVYRTYITTSLQDAEDKYKEIRHVSIKNVHVNVTNALHDDIMTIKEFKEKYADKISESRKNYNYIFGGTDNRNTAEIKTFNELEHGDKVYWFSDEGNKSILSFTFEKIIKDGNDAWIDLSGGAEWNCKVSDLDLSTMVDYYGYCLSTNLDELYDVLEKQLKIKNARNIKIEEH